MRQPSLFRDVPPICRLPQVFWVEFSVAMFKAHNAFLFVHILLCLHTDQLSKLLLISPSTAGGIRGSNLS
jgi:hypothetical protein